MKTNFVYITAGSLDEARAIAKELITNRFAACVNILENMRSLYWWEGEMKEDQEVIVIAKTKESMVPALIDKVKSVHSYECPCVVSLAITDGNKPFLDWILSETGEEVNRVTSDE